MKKIIFLCAFMIFGGVLFAQTTEEIQNAVDFKDGGAIREDWFMEFFSGWKELLSLQFGDYILIAKVLGGAFCLIFFAIKSYEMMTGDKKLEIMPLLRPFGLCLIIINWTSFVALIESPMNAIQNHASAKYEAREQIVNNYRIERAKYQYLLVQAMYNLEAETEVSAKESTAFLDDPLAWGQEKIAEGWDGVVKPIIALKNKMQIGMQLLISQALETIALWILRGCIYLLFSIQIIYSSILAILGPLSVAMSILPAFRDSFTSWIARFISVNLYVAIGYIILITVSILQEHALRSEISKYQELVSDGGVLNIAQFAFVKASGLISFGSVIIAFLVSAVSLTTVPSISTWIVNTSGVSSAVSTMGRQGNKATSMATKVLTKL